MGGGVAMQYAIDYPQEATSLTLINPMSPYGMDGTKGPDGRKEESCVPDNTAKILRKSP